MIKKYTCKIENKLFLNSYKMFVSVLCIFKIIYYTMQYLYYFSKIKSTNYVYQERL